MSKNLSFLELKQVASLKTNPGYIILIDSIQAELDTLTDQLRVAPPATEQQILGKWRAYTEIFHKLSTVPEEFALEVANFETAPERQQEMPQRTMEAIPFVLSKQAEEALLQMYEAKKQKLK